MIGAEPALVDVERDVDHVAAAMERQRLHDLVAVGGDRLQLRVAARRRRRRAFARTGQHLVRRAVIGHAVADEARLRDERAIGAALQREIRLRRVLRVAVLVERNLRDRAADRVDVRDIEIGADLDGLSGDGRSGGRRCAGAPLPRWLARPRAE